MKSEVQVLKARQKAEGGKLKEKRVAAGLLQQDLADVLKVHWTTVSRMERGEVKISEASAAAMDMMIERAKLLKQKARKK